MFKKYIIQLLNVYAVHFNPPSKMLPTHNTRLVIFIISNKYSTIYNMYWNILLVKTV